MVLIRNTVLCLLLAMMVAVAHGSFATHAQAKDGGGSSGGSGSSGSGSNSGHGGGDDGGGDDHSGRGGGGDHDDDDDDSDYARQAVNDGRILPLKSVLKKIDARRYGKVIDVRVRRSFLRDVYQIKVRDKEGAIRTIRVDAKRGTILGDD